MGKPCEDISEGVECNGFDINEKAALVVLCDGVAKAEAEAVQADLLAVAEEIAAKGKEADDKEPEFICFYASATEGPVGQGQGGRRQGARVHLLLRVGHRGAGGPGARRPTTRSPSSSASTRRPPRGRWARC